ncbi:MAG TPA: acyl-CoA dehydrogenase family protein [Candidatus Dormibacteraeota bacterium]|nr:acyl-CoA dehydrogenase family protein [Candidatus Dormibacteraeota bacterium]
MSGGPSFRALVREFAQEVVRPRAAQVDRERQFPRAILEEAARLGLMGILVPPAYGGMGLDHACFAACIEELAEACASTAVIVDVHGSVATEPILRFGSEEQRRVWLPRLARGEVLGAFALTEPGAGSDAASLRATARRRGHEWVLTGTKVFITNVGEAGLYVVFARTGEAPGARGLSAFLVPADSPGLRVGQVFEKMGLHGSPTGELVLDEVRVPAANLLHVQGRGFEVAMRSLDSGRIGISAQALGIARAALGEALEWARARGEAGREAALALADVATKLEAGRGLVQRAARRCSAGLPFTREASMAKLFCTDLAMEAASVALEVTAEAGEGQGFGRHFRDAKALQIYEGTNQVQRVVIARQLLGTSTLSRRAGSSDRRARAPG